ncbi:alpha/beta hydrolase [Comamonas antarctica]|uniref:alpha/beta hydrolase n=1 Tax=Comamonas antarctica TaxID=2743470 RepID=UPI0028F15E44|nr:alpha/beta hydrolase [Comamonas antarctica]
MTFPANTSAAPTRRDFVKTAGLGLAALGALGQTMAADAPQSIPEGADNFYRSRRVTVQKVRFPSQYQLQIAGNLVLPKNLARDRRAPAIIVGHPMGATKEQSAMLYAQKLAEQGFVTLAIDLPYWGESEGLPRSLVAPDTYADAFSAAADYLAAQDFIAPERIGVLGICGSGGFAISAAKLDPRLKAIATVSMYDMGAVTRNGLNRAQTPAQRQALLAKAQQQRAQELASGTPQWLDYLPLQLPPDADAVTREFHDFYRTPRGMHLPAGVPLERTQNRRLSSEVRFMNFYPFNDIESIAPRPLLFISGDQAHSREFSEDAYRRAAGPKELLWVPGAGHVDLYDRVTLIPWDRLAAFFTQHLA